MKITPLDIRQKQFPRKVRGLDPKEVQGFLELVESEMEELVRESIQLKDDVKRKQQRIDEYREQEKTLQETMVAAQHASDDIRDSAKREAEILVSEAELQAERIVQGAHTRLVQILDEIGELKRQRAQFEAGVRSLVEAELKLLEVFQSQPGPHVPKNIEFLAPKVRAAPPASSEGPTSVSKGASSSK
jgi:cell division initiation protein